MRNYKKINLSKAFKVAAGTITGVAVLSTSTIALASNFTTAKLSNPTLVEVKNISEGTYTVVDEWGDAKKNNDNQDKTTFVGNYGATGALEFIHNKWVVVKQSKKAICDYSTILIDQLGGCKTYDKGVLGHANDMTFYEGETKDLLFIATAGDQTNAKSDAQIKAITVTYADESYFYSDTPVAYKLDAKITNIGGEIGGITYIGKEKINNVGTKPVFVLKNNQKKKLFRVYLDGSNKKFVHISTCSITNPTPCKKGNTKKEDTTAKTIGQGVSYYKGQLYMGYGIRPSENEKCDNRMLIGQLSYSTVKNNSKANVTSYINKANSGYSTYEVECIAFNKNGTMYFDTNGMADGKQIDEIVKISN